LIISDIKKKLDYNESNNGNIVDDYWLVEHAEAEMLKFAQSAWLLKQIVEIREQDTGPEPESIDSNEFLTLPNTLDESAFATFFSFRAKDILGHEGIVSLMKRWCRVYYARPHVQFIKEKDDDAMSVDEKPNSNSNSTCTSETELAKTIFAQTGPLCCKPLIRLENSYTELYSRHYQGNCADCLKPKHDRAICLLCGESLLAGLHDRKPVRHTLPPKEYWGECTRHTMEHHSGVGMVFLLNRPSIILIKGLQSVYWRSIYTDQHGEDQRAIGRALPMFFDEERFKEAEKIWTENRIVYEVVAKRNKDTSSIIGAFF